MEISKRDKINEKAREGEKEYMSKKLSTIYEIFKDYTREQVDEMLSKLNEKEQELITLRYGTDLDNPITSKEWNKEKNNRYYGNLIPKMKQILKNPNYTPRTKNSKTTDENSVHKETLPENTQNTKISTTKFMKDSIEEEILIVKEDYIKALEPLKTPVFEQLLNTLTIKEKTIVCLKLGYVDNKYFTTDSISEFLGIEPEEVRESTRKVLLLYKNNINEFIDKAVEYATDKPKPNILTKTKDN